MMTYRQTGVQSMPILTITLSEERYLALKEAAAKRRKTLVAVIDESLEFYGIKTSQTALEWVAQARRRAAVSEEASLELVSQEVSAVRLRLSV
jgi:hypothetical protein